MKMKIASINFLPPSQPHHSSHVRKLFFPNKLISNANSNTNLLFFYQTDACGTFFDTYIHTFTYTYIQG